MRPFKFRVWDNDQKKMFLPRGEIYADNPDDFNFPTLAQNFEISENYGDFGSFPSKLYFSNNYIIQQFTGILDKNGKEIYEGDILKFREVYMMSIHEKKIFHIGEVKFKSPAFYIVGERSTFEDCKILGNIFEDQELLK